MEELNNFYRNNKGLCLAFKSWIDRNVKPFNLVDGLQAVYDFCEGKHKMMIDVLTQIKDTMKQKVQGRSQVHADIDKTKIDIIPDENGRLTVVGYGKDREKPLTGQHRVEDPIKTKKGSVNKTVLRSKEKLDQMGKRLRELFISFSKRSPKFDQSECLKLWERAGIDGRLITIGTLQHYAEEDNPEEYKKLKQYYYNSLQETIIQSSSDVDIAQYTYNNYGFRHMFSGKDWYFFNDNLWNKIGDQKIYEEISHSVRADFSERRKEDIMRFSKQLSEINKKYDEEVARDPNSEDTKAHNTEKKAVEQRKDNRIIE